jgi:hypothetical protein
VLIRRRLACLGTVASLASLAAGSVAPARAVLASVPGTTQFTFASQSRDPVGEGATAAYTPAVASFGISGTAQSVTVSIGTAVDGWTATFAAPQGQTLAPGAYASAVTAGSQSGSQAGLAVFDGPQRNCGGSVTGSFTVNAIGTDASGNVNVLDVSFTQWCALSSVGPPVMQGLVQFNAPATVSLSNAQLQEQNGTLISGVAVPFTVAVDPQAAGAATGKVSLRDGSTTLATVDLDGNGQAVFGYALAEGTHLLTASYSGDASHPSGDSAIDVIRVDRSPSTTAYSFTGAAGDPVALGGSGTLGPGDASFTPSGTLGDATVQLATSTDTWTIEMKPALGGTLQPGATYTAGTDPYGPQLLVAEDGRSCSGGSFTVDDIGGDWWGGVTMIGATFTQSCGGGATTLSGSLQDAVPPDGPNPVTMTRLSPSSDTEVGTGGSVTVQASVLTHSSTTGTVRFMDGATIFADVPIDATGNATATVSLTGTGLHIVSANYLGDSANQAATGLLEETVVPPPPTTAVLTASPSTIDSGQQLNLRASVSGSSGVPTGTVTFYDGGTPVGTSGLDGFGVSSLQLIPSAGVHTFTATYGGDAADLASTSSSVSVTVRGSTSTTLAASASSIAAGQPVTFQATVAASANGVPTGGVAFYDGTTALATVIVDGTGAASLTTSALAAGTHQVSAAYTGDSLHAASNSNVVPVTVTVATSTSLTASPTTVSLGQQVTLHAAVTSPANGVPTADVTFYDGATTLGVVALDGSGAASLVVTMTTGGVHAFSATYAGDTLHQGSGSSLVTVTVVSPTTTALGADASNATFGSPVTFTATVTSAGGNVPSGGVTFRDGSTVLGSAPLNANGIAQLAISSLGLGTHSVTASYGGDTTDTASSSSAVTVTVRYPTTTTLATPQTTVSGNAKLQIAVTSPYGSTPTGTVTVFDGTTAVATVSLNNQGRANVAVNHLPSGQHPFSATYNGSAIDTPSTSAVLVITAS